MPERIPVVGGTYMQLYEAGIPRSYIQEQFVEVFPEQGGRSFSPTEVTVMLAGIGGDDMPGVPLPQPGVPQTAAQRFLYPDWEPMIQGPGIASVGYNGGGINGYGDGYAAPMTTTPTHADVVPGVLGHVNGVPVSGPGVPEPPRQLVVKQWSIAVHSNTYGTFRVFFFKLIDGRTMCYNPSTKSWKIWRPKKPIVLYRGKVTLSQAVRTQRMLDRLWRTVAKRTKALKLA